MGEPELRVCMVCLGNICRSPTAEAVLRQRLVAAGLDDRVAVESAGTGGWHVGDDADARARAAFEARGYALDHRARQFTADWFARFDLVLAMDGDNLRNLRVLIEDPDDRVKLRLLRSFDPASPAGDQDVPDPYYGGRDGFAHVLDLVEAACDGLVAHLGTELSAA